MGGESKLKPVGVRGINLGGVDKSSGDSRKTAELADEGETTKELKSSSKPALGVVRRETARGR